MPQNPLLQLAQLRPGLQPELLIQDHPTLPVGLERVGLAARAVEREHQLATDPLPLRMLPHECFELGDELTVSPAGEISVHTPLESVEPQLLQPGNLGQRPRLIAQVAERLTAKERYRLA